MFAVDYKVTKLDVEHRRSLLTLLKLEHAAFEPCYTKIPILSPVSTNKRSVNPHGLDFPSSSSYSQQSRRKFIPSHPPFGIFTLVEMNAGTPANSGLLRNDQQLKIEIYHDRDSMELICYGNASMSSDGWTHLTNKDPLYRNDSLVQATNYLILEAQRTIIVDLYHVSKGDFPLPAGTIEIVIRVYRVDIARCIGNCSLDMVSSNCKCGFSSMNGHEECKLSSKNFKETPDITVDLMPKRTFFTEEHRKEASPPNMTKMPTNLDSTPTINSDSISATNSLHQCINEEAECAEYDDVPEESVDDYDSVDEFVNAFRCRTSMVDVSTISIHSTQTAESIPKSVLTTTSKSQSVLSDQSVRSAKKKSPSSKQPKKGRATAIYARAI